MCLLVNVYADVKCTEQEMDLLHEHKFCMNDMSIIVNLSFMVTKDHFNFSCGQIETEQSH